MEERKFACVEQFSRMDFEVEPVLSGRDIPGQRGYWIIVVTAFVDVADQCHQMCSACCISPSPGSATAVGCQQDAVSRPQPPESPPPPHRREPVLCDRALGPAVSGALAALADGEVLAATHCCLAARRGYQLFPQTALAEGIARSGRQDLTVCAVALDGRNHNLNGRLQKLGLSDLRGWGNGVQRVRGLRRVHPPAMGGLGQGIRPGRPLERVAVLDRRQIRDLKR